TFQSPSSAYDTHPNKMIINGKVVDSKVLSQAVNQAMLVQGKRAVKHAKEGIETAKETMKEAGQNAKEAGQKMMDKMNE
ncbi:MAG: hypothetical protein KAI02_04840, partial [Gammaproteobacteria bacterium]|nr:hypothetical protein [Gammaproteobacteria bacterium]